MRIVIVHIVRTIWCKYINLTDVATESGKYFWPGAVSRITERSVEYHKVPG
jgi:hypothetical protein